MLQILKNNRYLLGQLIKKDIQQKFQGTVLGVIWTFLSPILMLIVYTFVFCEIFQNRWSAETTNKYEFAMMLFAGLSSFNMISEVMSRATTLIVSNTNYVKKVIFPLDILPIVITFSALFNCVISYLILIAANFVLSSKISPTLYQSFLAFIPLIILTAGIGYIISAVSVYLKDMVNLISVLITILMFMSPVFYSLETVPESYRIICEFNVITYIIENFRNVILYGNNLNPEYFFISAISSIIIFALGWIIFHRVKEGFADVL